MSGLIYRKTAAGLQEMSQRSAGLSLPTRTVLIMVNGKDAVSTLAAKGLAQLNEHLDQLLAKGLIEPAAPPAMVAPSRPRPVAPPALVKAPPAPPNSGALAPSDEAESLQALKRKALLQLTQHFGPDTPDVAQPLLAATSLKEWQRALEGIEARLAMYLGRKGAAREMALLRP